jgi:hypothetical protein
MAQQGHGNLGAEILADLSYAAVSAAKILAEPEQTRRLKHDPRKVDTGKDHAQTIS